METTPPSPSCQISFLPHAKTNDPVGTTTGPELIERIKSGEWKKQVTHIRARIRAGASKDEIDELKKRLPGATWCGTFSKRKEAALVKYSGMLCADVDKLPLERIEELHDLAHNDPCVAGAFVSPSGTGLKVIFRVSDERKNHAVNFATVRAHVQDHYHAQVDEKTSDIPRLCFVSHDPAAFWKDAIPLPLTCEELPQVITGNGATQGDRDNECFKLACRLRDEGKNQDETTLAVVDFAQSCNPPLSEAEARKCVRSAFTRPARETKALPPPVAQSLSAFVRRHGDDPDELIRFRYLCRGGGLLLCGPTGIGKSSLALQLALSWGIGRDCFGLKPVRPIKSLIIQAENDDGDMAEMRDGVIEGLSLSAADAKAACENIFIAREDARTGLAFFCEVVRPLLAEHEPDLLWIDPALAYLGGEASQQSDVGKFLRNWLNPLIHEHGCGVVVVHHTNKPPTGKQKPDWGGPDLAYLGSGSIEWANWARAVLALRSISSHDVFELQAAKRGNRLGWRDTDGERIFMKYLAHSKQDGAIYWRQIGDDELDTGGRPQSYDPEEVLALLPPEGLTRKDWLALADEECGVSKATLDRVRLDAVKAGRILKSKVSGKWQPIKSA